jgi:NAD(P)-dependent dehydrogenase (short-subunit alcohol dehydrogenase family)
MKSVVCIGATQGSGRELAAEYAHRGANVVVTGRSAERVAEVAGELSKGPVYRLGWGCRKPSRAGTSAAWAVLRRAITSRWNGRAGFFVLGLRNGRRPQHAGRPEPS